MLFNYFCINCLLKDTMIKYLSSVIINICKFALKLNELSNRFNICWWRILKYK